MAESHCYIAREKVKLYAIYIKKVKFKHLPTNDNILFNFTVWFILPKE